MFQLEVDQASRIVFFTLPETLDIDAAVTYGMAKDRAVELLGHPLGQHSVLMDVRNTRIMPQNVLQVLLSYMRTTAYSSSRIAILVGDGTSRMQFRRLVEIERVRPGVRLFQDRQGALEWLQSEPASDQLQSGAA